MAGLRRTSASWSQAFDEWFVEGAWHVGRGEVVPAQAAGLAVVAGEAGADGGVVGDGAAEEVADEGFDGGGFGEGHGAAIRSNSVLMSGGTGAIESPMWFTLARSMRRTTSVGKWPRRSASRPSRTRSRM